MPEAIKARLGRGLPRATDKASPSRRQVLRGVAAAGVVAATGAPAACGGNDDAGSTGATDRFGNATTPPASASSSESSSSSAGEPLAKVADIPVGGGTIFNAEKVVVTQPTKGHFKAFSAVCTHQGCLVTGVSDGIISCSCHGSRYSAADGSVQDGPAPGPLPKKKVKVLDGRIILA
jgi:Rieske Fe-S protein